MAGPVLQHVFRSLILGGGSESARLGVNVDLIATATGNEGMRRCSEL